MPLNQLRWAQESRRTAANAPNPAGTDQPSEAIPQPSWCSRHSPAKPKAASARPCPSVFKGYPSLIPDHFLFGATSCSELSDSCRSSCRSRSFSRSSPGSPRPGLWVWGLVFNEAINLRGSCQGCLCLSKCCFLVPHREHRQLLA